MIQNINDTNFLLQNIDTGSIGLKPSDLIVLLVKSKRCGWCDRYMPQYEQFAVQYPDIPFLAIEASKNEQLVYKHWSNLAHPKFVIEGVPAVILYKGNGVPISAVEDRFELDKVINAYRLSELS